MTERFASTRVVELGNVFRGGIKNRVIYSKYILCV